MRVLGPAVGIVLALACVACSGSAEPSAPARRDRTRASERSEASAPPGEAPPLAPATYPAPARLVAIGDVHGDLQAFRGALRAAGAIDESERWIGGALWVVQVGDLLDRGDDEDEVLALVERLEREAAEAGGRFLSLLGNHELMNAQLDFRYVTPEGFEDFAELARDAPAAARRAGIPGAMLGRVVAFMPGGPIARTLAGRAVAVRVGDTVFVHGGLTTRHLERGLEGLNRDARAFLLGEAPISPSLTAQDGPVWHRELALEDDAETCAALAEVLERVGAARMVIGHTVHDEGIGSACEGRVWRVDVGMSRHYGGPIQVLEIAGDELRVLRGSR